MKLSSKIHTITSKDVEFKLASFCVPSWSTATNKQTNKDTVSDWNPEVRNVKLKAAISQDWALIIRKADHIYIDVLNDTKYSP